MRFTVSLSKRLTLKQLVSEFESKITTVNTNIQNIQIIKTKLIKTEPGLAALDYFSKIDKYLTEKLKKNKDDDYFTKILN
jgi:hypothetical protein